MAMFGALAAVLTILRGAPSLYRAVILVWISRFRYSVGTFAGGLGGRVVMELVKILVKLILKPTSTEVCGRLPISALDVPWRFARRLYILEA